MEDCHLYHHEHQWHDPLLITDVSCQQHHNQEEDSSHSSYSLPPLPSLEAPIMACSNNLNPSKIDGRSMLGYSLTSPDLVICAGSPDISSKSYENSPEFLKGTAIDLSFENGINGSEKEAAKHNPADEKLGHWETPEEELCSSGSFELPPPPVIVENMPKGSIPVMCINAGSIEKVVISGGVEFLEDSFFSGGDTIRTDAAIGNGVEAPLYQTARYGEFLYRFKALESGYYLIDLHLAEIVFVDGPPGMRVFDIFIQEQKVVSCLDIYARVGGNRPLVISDLRTCITDTEVLSVRFEGVTGNPIISGISIRRDTSAGFGEVELLKEMAMRQTIQQESPKGKDGEFQSLQLEYESQKKELTETRRALEELKRENDCRNRECKEAWKSLQELQNELMRKSMHVGSLAFAIEGQVKEKSRWFSSLRDLTRKLKILKMDQIKLSEEASEYTKCLTGMNEMSSTVQSKIKQLMESHEDLKNKFVLGAKDRKELYNKILELKGNIRVFCRCRPLSAEEIAAGASMTIDFEGAKEGELTVNSNGAYKKTFKFDAVFSPQADQVDVFEDTAPFATSVLDGYNVCIFAYGQTGTGKTFTMEGTDEARGVNYRTLEELFRIIDERKSTFQYEISVSVMEVYNEQIRDLLVSGSHQGVTAKRLEVKQVGEGTHHVPGLVEADVSNMTEVWEVLKTGGNSRAVGSTNANEHSSRSHCIHCVMVRGENLLNGECTRSKLWLVDLAGSERIAKTEVQGERLKETQNINRSLAALGDVISALATKCPHIPFRNSKLTHLLQDSLGGDSKTLMFVQISPNENDLSETLCSLNFASRVRGIELGPAKKQVDNTELIRYKQMVEKNKQDMRSKDLQIKKLEDTINGLDVKIKDKDLKHRNLQDKFKELESQLLIERRLARQHVDTKLRQHQEEEQSSAPVRSPAGPRSPGIQKNLEQINLNRPLAENNSKPPLAPPTTDGYIKHNDLAEKENNPEMAEQLLLPKQIGRASICTTPQRILPAPAPLLPRRNSVIPLPSVPAVKKLPAQLLPQTPIQANSEDVDGVEAQCPPEPTHWDSPREHKNAGKKLSTTLRRSLQKKMQMKSPMQQHFRRGGVNVGMEKVRVSIGSRGKMGHRVLLGNAKRVSNKDIQQKQSQREKERGWNIGTKQYS